MLIMILPQVAQAFQVKVGILVSKATRVLMVFLGHQDRKGTVVRKITNKNMYVLLDFSA